MLIGYCRVSMADDRQTTDLQQDALLAAGIDRRNIYEARTSGAKDNPPGLKACLKYLTEGDILVVWRLDRLGRSLAHLIEIITGLKARGIGFRSLNETIDERALIRERIIAGLRAAELRGCRGGRPRVLDHEKIKQRKNCSPEDVRCQQLREHLAFHGARWWIACSENASRSKTGRSMVSSHLRPATDNSRP